MFKDKKQAVKEILIAIGSKKPEVDKEDYKDSEMGEVDEGKESAAEDLISAMKSGDAKAVVEAFEALMEMCK